MEIIADQNIPHVKEAFAELGTVKLYPGREISNSLLNDCDCLVVRTITTVNESLLKNTPVKYVGTATIGTDHIDLDYLRDSDIEFSNAAGCNAEAASEYVISGLFALSRKKGFDPFKLKAGIVGFGNVGSRLFEKLRTLGIECIVNDPLIDHCQFTDINFVSLDQLLEECDLISLHVPFTSGSISPHPTHHLLSYNRLKRLKNKTVLINAARGEIIDNNALTAILASRNDLTVFLDTWETEPDISIELLNKVDLATPHIAGYSVEGRLRGTQMILNAASRHFGLHPTWNMESLLPVKQQLSLSSQPDKVRFWQNLFSQHFDIWRDDAALRSAIKGSRLKRSTAFDSLRRVYPDRLEYDRFTFKKKPGAEYISQLQALRFNVL